MIVKTKMSNNLSENMETIEKEINKISKLTNFKKIITKHNSIKKKIKVLMEKINNIENELYGLDVKNDCDISPKSDKIISEDEFTESVNVLKVLKHDFEKSEEIEEQMRIYKEATKYILDCKGYLENQKMEIIEEK